LVGARYYDAQVGRFISRDTYLDQPPYLYCDHDPVNAVDPSGHNVIDWIVERLEGLPRGTGAVFMRGISIFISIWVGAIIAAKHFHKHMGHQPRNSWGDLYGNSHQHQRRMVDWWSSPDSR